MPIPKYDEMYRAFLDCLADGQLHRSKEVKDTVAGVFSVSEKERTEMLPSGKQQLFDNRIGWARTYLKKAGLVQSPSRGVYMITPAGKSSMKILLKSITFISSALRRFDSLFLQTIMKKTPLQYLWQRYPVKHHRIFWMKLFSRSTPPWQTIS